MVEEISETSYNTKEKHEEYYNASHIDEVSKVRAKSVDRHTYDCLPLDKVTDATDEVGVYTYTNSVIAFDESTEVEKKSNVITVKK